MIHNLTGAEIISAREAGLLSKAEVRELFGLAVEAKDDLVAKLDGENVVLRAEKAQLEDQVKSLQRLVEHERNRGRWQVPNVYPMTYPPPVRVTN